MKRFTYMDNAATTRMDDKVLEAMMPYFTQEFGNPSALYAFADESKTAVATAREQVAKAIGADPQEIYFTASGTEADNWAIKGTAFANCKKGKHIITSTIEHHAVLNSMKFLERQGYEITYLPVNEEGLVSVEDLKKAIRPDTVLVTIMFANNEIGTIEPIKELAAVCKENGVYFHTDAVQAVGHVRINVKEMGIDMLSSSSHKFYGPKGVGFLYIRKGVRLANFVDGGGQERSRRGGTENVAGIVGLGKAIELVYDRFDENVAKMTMLRDKLIKGIEENIPYVRLNGPRTNRLCNNVNFSFTYVEGESILLWLDIAGIAASSGSACASASLDPSHVLLAIGLPAETAHGSIRFSLGEYSTEEDVDYTLSVLTQTIEKLRKMSPLFEGVEGR